MCMCSDVPVSPAGTYAVRGYWLILSVAVAVVREAPTAGSLSCGRFHVVASRFNADLDKRDSAGRLVHLVPRASMRNKWLVDDDVVMKRSGKRGVPGTPHWKVERDVRRTTI